MKKYLLFLVAIILATVAQAADGDTFTYSEYVFKVISERDHTVKLTRNGNHSTSIDIPSIVSNGEKDYSVTEIGEHAFSTWNTIMYVSISNSVIKIGDYAFGGCSNLRSIVIPKSVAEIAYGAFSNCKRLEEFIVEDGNLNFASEDGVLFNGDKSKLMQCPGAKTTYKIPDSVKEIGDYAFHGCSSLISVSIPNSVIVIGKTYLLELV